VLVNNKIGVKCTTYRSGPYGSAPRDVTVVPYSFPQAICQSLSLTLPGITPVQ